MNVSAVSPQKIINFRSNLKYCEQAPTCTNKLELCSERAAFYPGVQVNKWSGGDRLYNAYQNSLSSPYNKLKVMDLLNEGKLEPKEAEKFLHKITADKKTAYAFIDEITRDENGNIEPQKSPEIVKTLVDKLGGKKNFEKWYCAPKGYLEAFSQYTRDFYENAGSVDELCEFLPNWGPWTLKKKFRNLCEQKGIKPYRIINHSKDWQQKEATDGYTLGRVPKEFKNKENYRKLIGQLKENILEHQDIEKGLDVFNIRSAELLSGGCSGKCNILVNNKYVIKIDLYKYNNYDSDYYNELKDSLPDSLFLNSMVDYYTTLHSPKSAAEIYFYDDLSSSCVYEYVKGKNPEFESNNAVCNTQSEDFKKAFKQMNDIGINYTDYNSNNYKITPDGIKCIDSGHCVYSDLLKPGAGGLTISLPARTGFNPLEFDGRLAQILEDDTK